jgi:hypothetical protein
MDDSAAARLADRLRAGMKVRALSGAELARQVGRLTGDGEPDRMWVSRRIGMAKHPVSLMTVSPDLFAIAEVLQLDPVDLVAGAMRDAMAGPNPYQSPNCTHPNRVGAGCQACCDDCNNDRHVCHSCDTLTGHNRTVCPDCSTDE